MAETMLYMHEGSIESIELYDEPQPESLREGMQIQMPQFFEADITQHMKPINGSLSPIKHTPRKPEFTAMFDCDQFIQILENQDEIEKLKGENIALKQRLFAQSKHPTGSENEPKQLKKDSRRGKSLSPRKILAAKCPNELLRPHTADGISVPLDSSAQNILQLEAKLVNLERENERLQRESREKESEAECLRVENSELKDKIETLIITSEFDQSVLAARQKKLVDLVEFTQMELDFCSIGTVEAAEYKRLKDSYTTLERAYRELDGSFEEARADWVRENKSWEIQCNKEAERAKRRGERVQRLQIELAKMNAEILVLNEMRNRGWGEDDTLMI